MRISSWQLFWSSDILTGSQTARLQPAENSPFWSSDILTGSQTTYGTRIVGGSFWSSDILTGSQTRDVALDPVGGFGAVTF